MQIDAAGESLRRAHKNLLTVSHLGHRADGVRDVPSIILQTGRLFGCVNCTGMSGDAAVDSNVVVVKSARIGT